MHLSVWKYIINIACLKSVSAHTCGHPQGSTLQRWPHRDVTEDCEPVHRCKIPSSKNTWFEVNITF